MEPTQTAGRGGWGQQGRRQTAGSLGGALLRSAWGLALGHPPTPPLPSPNLNELLLFQVPLLDAVVPGATEQDVSLDGQTFDTVIVRGLKVVGWADGAHHAVAQLEHLQRRRAEPREGRVWGRP